MDGVDGVDGVDAHASHRHAPPSPRHALAYRGMSREERKAAEHGREASLRESKARPSGRDADVRRGAYRGDGERREEAPQRVPGERERAAGTSRSSGRSASRGFADIPLGMATAPTAASTAAATAASSTAARVPSIGVSSLSSFSARPFYSSHATRTAPAPRPSHGASASRAQASSRPHASASASALPPLRFRSEKHAPPTTAASAGAVAAGQERRRAPAEDGEYAVGGEYVAGRRSARSAYMPHAPGDASEVELEERQGTSGEFSDFQTPHATFNESPYDHAVDAHHFTHQSLSSHPAAVSSVRKRVVDELWDQSLQFLSSASARSQPLTAPPPHRSLSARPFSSITDDPDFPSSSSSFRRAAR